MFGAGQLQVASGAVLARAFLYLLPAISSRDASLLQLPSALLCCLRSTSRGRGFF